MKRPALHLVPLLATALLSSGCASIFLGSHDDLEVVTEPPGATARAGDVSIVTPGVLKLKRGGTAPVVVRVEKEGFQPREIAVAWSRSGAVWTNVVGIGAGAAAALFSTLFMSWGDPDGAESTATTGLLVGGAVTVTGLTIDLASPRTYSLERDDIVLRLEPVRLAEAPKGAAR
ncbi:MAG: hypothetical protein IPP07_12160 [Holophagales bacterium]|nr:hypothetical protein [Holophagales bacterium]MBK9965608.1 hypothetical protein [Holophagales bacterium]